MKMLKTTAIAALMTAAVGLSAIAPATAQQAPAAPAAQQAPGAGPGTNGPMGNFRQHNQGPRQGGGDFLSFERGAEGVEIALVRLSHAIEMTADQQALFDTLKTDALAAADTFSKAVEGLRPAKPADGATAERPSITERLDTRIAIQTAQLDALKSVQPAAKAFFDSLTDEQKAQLTPERPDGQMGKHGQRQGHNQGQRPGPMGGMNGGPDAPAGAPTDAPAPTNT